MKEYLINNKEAGQRMDKFLFKIMDQASKSFIYKMLRKKNIVLNDKKATGQEVLCAQDSIKIYFSDETFEKFATKAKVVTSKTREKSTDHPKADVVYENEDILIINKPAGLLSQKATNSDYSANEMIIDYLLEKGELTDEDLLTFRPSICNRLDRNTSGLLIGGKTIKGLQSMADQLKKRSMNKYYLTIVWGTVSKPQHLTGHLVKNHKTNQVTVSKNGEGDLIETAYVPIKQYSNATLLEVHLITGRSHQIRAHLSSVGHPVLGDMKYGNTQKNLMLEKSFGLRHHLLHSYRMEFPDGLVVTAEPPKMFQTIQNWLENE